MRNVRYFDMLTSLVNKTTSVDHYFVLMTFALGWVNRRCKSRMLLQQSVVDVKYQLTSLQLLSVLRA